MAQYVTRHGACAAAVNVANAVNLNQAGAAAIITVPTGVRKIVELIVSVSASIVAVASAGVTLRLVMTGNGLVTEQHITIGTVREDTTSTGGAHIVPPTRVPVDIDIVAGNQIDLNAFMAGVDPGTPEVDVTLVFA